MIALGLMLALLLGCLPACALEGPLKATVTGEILEADALSDESIAAANQMLGRLRLNLWAWPDGEKAQLQIDGKDMWQVETVMGEEENHTIFSGTTDYVTDAGETTALEVLTGQSGAGGAIRPIAYFHFAQEFYSLADAVAEAKMNNGTTALGNAGESSRYARYDLTAEQMNDLWRQGMALFWPRVFPDGGYAALHDAFMQVEFTGDVRIKRLFDRQGQDMGLQLTGNGCVLGSERKISLLFGYTPGKGGSLTVSTKALSGKDSLKTTVSFKETLREEKNTFAFTLNHTSTLADGQNTFSAEGKMVQEGEKWTGEVELGGKDQVIWTLSPDLTVQEEKIEGRLEIGAKEKKKTRIRAVLQLKLEKANQRTAPESRETVFLTGKTAEETDAALAFEKLVMMRALKYLLNDLAPDARVLFTHEMRTDSWHTGPRVEVPEDTEEQWIVEDDAQ